MLRFSRAKGGPHNSRQKAESVLLTMVVALGNIRTVVWPSGALPEAWAGYHLHQFYQVVRLDRELGEKMSKIFFFFVSDILGLYKTKRNGNIWMQNR